MKNILVTGASGMLGGCAVMQLSGKFDVYATGNSNLPDYEVKNYKPFNLMQEDYAELIQWSNPNVILHCAALTNGNYCDKNPSEALNVNGVTLSKFLKHTDESVKIIYISTDAVFESNLKNAKESDCLNPESVYGKSKELGEFFLRQSSRNYCILRTTIVGYNTGNIRQSFVEWIINSLKNETEIGLFEDVWFNPITTRSLIKEIEENIIPNDIMGIYHLSGREVCTKLEFGQKLANALELNRNYIKSNSILAFKDRAKRSTDQSISVLKYCEEFKRELPDISQTINELKNMYYEKY